MGHRSKRRENTYRKRRDSGDFKPQGDAGRKRRETSELCGGSRTPNKVRYTSLSSAQGAAVMVRGKNIYVYQCPDCGGFHPTRQRSDLPAVAQAMPRAG